MKKLSLALIVFLAMQACTPASTTQQVESFQVQTVVAGTMQALTQLMAIDANTPAPPEFQVMPTPTLTHPAIVPPTTTLSPILPSFGNNPYLIQFDANGTYKDVIDSIPTGESKTYSVRAMKGQIMSVSYWPQSAGINGYIPMQIKGSNGQILCPQGNNECKFWRGVLPSSQDYFMTLTSIGINASFIIRVAINPPGKDTQFFHYENPITGLSLTYSDIFAPTNGLFDGYITTGSYKIEPELILHLIDTGMFANTNLGAAYFTIGTNSNPDIVTTCIEANPNGVPEQVMETETVNGYNFVHTQTSGVALGHASEEFIYRMIHNNICYEVIYHVHFTDVGYYPSGTIHEFDKNAVLKKLKEIFSTFMIN